jgi:hypothetical protein
MHVTRLCTCHGLRRPNLDAGDVERAAQVTNNALELSVGVASSAPSNGSTSFSNASRTHKSETGVTDLLARGPVHPLQVLR